VSELSKSENEIYSLRKEKEENIKSSNLESFATSFNNATNINLIHSNHSNTEAGTKTNIRVSVRGRILGIRSFGKLTFIDLADETGKIQLVSTKGLLSEDLHEYLSNIDVGDIAGASGTLMKTKKGELSIELQDFILLTKSFRNFPEKWHGLKDKETRFRQRYLDFVVNELIRTLMTSENFLEVETPTLQPKAGGAIARPFLTHHNAMGIDMYLRIAPELYLKRLVIGGFEKVFELGKVFRNEGIDLTHSPEFTMMESYEAYTDVNGVMNMVEKMCQYIIENLDSGYEVQYSGKIADFNFPWERKSMFELVSKKFSVEISHDSNLDDLKVKFGEEHSITTESKTIGEFVFELFENHIENEILNPLFVTDYPKEVSPFARESKDKQGITERFELFAFGSELANGFSELIDPRDQEERLKTQAFKKAEGDEEAHVQDEDYIEALEYGLPPTGGLGFGVDRFVMMLTNNESIREVIAFPHIKPEN
jgi:lysyl-tRNA synthetase class 2